jgi:hypothetical protein
MPDSFKLFHCLSKAKRGIPVFPDLHSNGSNKVENRNVPFSPAKTKKALTRPAGRASITHQRAPLSAGQKAPNDKKRKSEMGRNALGHNPGEKSAI